MVRECNLHIYSLTDMELACLFIVYKFLLHLFMFFLSSVTFFMFKVRIDHKQF